jgi:hypothetical protein
VQGSTSQAYHAACKPEPEHRFFTLERDWVDAGNLWRGAYVRRADGANAALALPISYGRRLLTVTMCGTAHDIGKVYTFKGRRANYSVANL